MAGRGHGGKLEGRFPFTKSGEEPKLMLAKRSTRRV